MKMYKYKGVLFQTHMENEAIMAKTVSVFLPMVEATLSVCVCFCVCGQKDINILKHIALQLNKKNPLLYSCKRMRAT